MIAAAAGKFVIHLPNFRASFTIVWGLSNIYSAWVKLKTKLEFAAHCFYWHNIDTGGEYDRERCVRRGNQPSREVDQSRAREEIVEKMSEEFDCEGVAHLEP